MPVIVSPTQIIFNDATVQTTAFTGGGGTVTSVATGNGLQGGTITTSGTLSVACPAFNTVGSYVMGGTFVGGGNQANLQSGSNYAAGTGTNQIRSSGLFSDASGGFGFESLNNLSGTWKYMGASTSIFPNNSQFAICCRVS
jgi:hypothetical protein